MATTTATAMPEGAVTATTLPEALRRTAAEHPEIVAVRTADDEVSLTWSALLARVDALAGGLAGIGVRRGDTVAIMLTNRPEFHIADLAAVMLGATPFSIYATYPAPEIAFLIGDADARVAIVEQAFLPAMLEARGELPGLEHVIVVDGDASAENVLALADVEGADPDFDGQAAAAAVQPSDLATLIYTSGTTGHPKGVQLTHHALMTTAAGVREVIGFPAGSRVLSWLPAAHIAERMAHHYIPVTYAGTVTCVPDPRTVLDHLPQVRPNWFFAVPRIWEKLKSGLEAMQAAQPEEARRPVLQALEASRLRLRLRQGGEPVPPELEQRVAAADEQIFSGIRAMLGLDQVLTVNVGAAPTPRPVIEFFHALGIELAELWGMSETCGTGAVNRPGKVRIGTVGTASPGVELRIDGAPPASGSEPVAPPASGSEPGAPPASGSEPVVGELLCRGAFLMTGYRNQPERTAEALDANGWLHTGDIGHIDSDGYLTIVDRKKEIIINSAGKNMSPANIEAEIKSSSPLIGQACCIGDARPYNTALIVLDTDFAPGWAQGNGLGERSLQDLATAPEMIAAVQEGIDTANAALARVEQIKRFAIVPGDWAPGGDELTPTMKLKRRPIAEKYAEAIDGLYSAAATSP